MITLYKLKNTVEFLFIIASSFKYFAGVVLQTLLSKNLKNDFTSIKSNL